MRPECRGPWSRRPPDRSARTGREHGAHRPLGTAHGRWQDSTAPAGRRVRRPGSGRVVGGVGVSPHEPLGDLVGRRSFAVTQQLACFFNSEFDGVLGIVQQPAPAQSPAGLQQRPPQAGRPSVGSRRRARRAVGSSSGPRPAARRSRPCARLERGRESASPSPFDRAEAVAPKRRAQRTHQRLRHLTGVLVAHVVAHAAVPDRVQVRGDRGADIRMAGELVEIACASPESARTSRASEARPIAAAAW